MMVNRHSMIYIDLPSTRYPSFKSDDSAVPGPAPGDRGDVHCGVFISRTRTREDVWN